MHMLQMCLNNLTYLMFSQPLWKIYCEAQQ